MEKTVKNTAEEFLTWLQVEKHFAQKNRYTASHCCQS